MARKRKKRRAAGGVSKKRLSPERHSKGPGDAESVSPEDASGKQARDWAEIGRAYALLALSGVLAFLGFAGFGVWPLAFVCLVPALWVMEQPATEGWAFFRRALFFGYVSWYGGFYWVVDTIVDFGGFPYLLAAFFASVFFVFLALQYVVALWLYRRARARGFNITLSVVVSFVAVEQLFPQLFDNFYGNSFHMLPYLVQVADLGGPLLLTGIAMLGNGAAYELVRAWLKRGSAERTQWPVAGPITFVATLAVFVGYSAYRVHDVESRMAAAPTIQVGVVQTNMGIFEKRDDPGEGLRRHLEQSVELTQRGDVDLIVWPESAATFRVPRELGSNVQDVISRALMFYRERNPGFPRVPIMFGGLSSMPVDGEMRNFNTAFLTDAEGRITGHYDKTYLLAFGEYLPFGETFPILHEWSPNSGHFRAGDRVEALEFGDYRIGALICYEDILPGFVRSVMNAGEPHLLVNVTNDAWFGDTQEPWVHLALAEMRAVENHRYLIRATNTGVSAVIDPLGRVVAHTETFEQASLLAPVQMLEGGSVYRMLGNWPGYLAALLMLYIGWIGRRSTPSPSPPIKTPTKPRAKAQEEEE
ncbi:MAG TPA: apolipoprotein N-acyltransferase [Polyangiaceae bacterium]|nr:apolipoprotein N-acyltransferase [Polyangiaceae bacterium]